MKYCLLLILLTSTLVACGGSNETNDNLAPQPTATRAAAALLTPTVSVQPVEFPAAEAAHDDLTEWWYYTGHMFTENGDRFGFEFVIFQVNRGNFPATYAAHFAITDNLNESFHYDQKIALNADQHPAEGLALKMGDWEMQNMDGHARLKASMEGYAIDLNLAPSRAPVLHNTNGYFEFGDVGGSYYYSRTNMTLSGDLTVGDQTLRVDGQAWMDHQWGNFVISSSGGWDWYALDIDNDRQLMLFEIRDQKQADIKVFGSLIDESGRVRSLSADEISIIAKDTWTSSTTNATYPSGWHIQLAAENWDLTVEPTLKNQELDTSNTTGVIYWEGEVTVQGTIAGEQANGLGYVELTGYAGPFQVGTSLP